MIETWKDIPSYEGYYQASSLGNIRSLRRKAGKGNRMAGGKLLRQYTENDGYKSVSLSKRGRIKTHHVHSLVISAFRGVKPKDKECRHLDGIRTNNQIKNLCWGSKKENATDRDNHGNTRKGEDAVLAVLTWDDVREIRRLYSIKRERKDGKSTGRKSPSKYSMSKLGEMFNVTSQAICYIVNNQTWKE